MRTRGLIIHTDCIHSSFPHYSYRYWYLQINTEYIGTWYHTHDTKTDFEKVELCFLFFSIADRLNNRITCTVHVGL
jgi:hypothetical protein